MDRDVEFLHKAYPQVDIRVIKATVLEHGEDVESTLSFLDSFVDEVKDVSPAKDTTESHFLHQSSSTVDVEAYTEMGLCDTNVAPELSYSNASSVDQDSLAGIVEETKFDKDLVINLIKEVSNLRAKADQEKIAALKAKSEAATRGESLLKMADEVRKQTSQRKQDNLLRMGEIYGEKAVLATEARELKLRLEQVKLQQEKAIQILNEIQVTLQGCYDAAVEERKMAEEEGLINEEKAQKLLTEEETLMAAAEQEAQKLDMEAESCMQLKEFLAHHGSVVDSLQGEISILCEDVESFKRQVEEGMWSSVSTASLQSNVNPEGPYTFRRCSMLSMASSQDLGQSFDSSRGSYSRASASISQGVSHLSEGSNVSSQESEKAKEEAMRNPSSGEDDTVWRHKLAGNGSLCGNTENTSSNLMDSVCSEIGGIRLSSLEMPENPFPLYGVNPLIRRSWASADEDEIKEAVRTENSCFSTERKDLELDSTNRTKECLDSERAGAGWVFTAQMEDCSSSSSSMVKIEADDYALE